jgi:xanthine dehydrogenase accessory factor
VRLYSDIAELTAEGRAFVLATVVSTQGSTPQKPGSKLLVLEGGELRGTVGGGAIEKQIVEAALELLADPTATTRSLEAHLTHDLGMCCGGTMTVFLEKHAAAARLWIFGAGHVAKEVAALAAHVDFRVTVVDERPEWANTARFPAATVVAQPPEEVAASLVGGRDCYFCVATHDHPLDQACVERLLPKPCAYVGVIGSRRKAARFRQRLEAAGFSKDDIMKMESPMGVAIQALTPQELAVSIVARLIEVRRGRQGPMVQTAS